MAIEIVSDFKAALHDTALAQFPILERGVLQTIDLFVGPLTSASSRLYWPQVLEAMGLALIVYLSGRQVCPRDGWRGFLRYCFPRVLYAHPSAIVDYQLMVLNAAFGFLFNILWRFGAPFFVGSLIAGLIAVAGTPGHPTAWTTGATIVIGASIVLIEDFANYWFHVLTHKVPFLWALHRVHHSAEVLMPLTAYRTHPLEYVLAATWRGAWSALVLAPAIYVYGGPPEPVQVLGIGTSVIVLGAFGTTIQHSHIWLSFGKTLDRIICVPSLHFLHHSQAPEHHDKNFAVIFSFWDWMFGTLVVPDGPIPLSLGIAGETKQPHPNAIVAWFVPLWEMVPGHAKLLDAATRLAGPSSKRLAERLYLVREL